TTWRRRSAGCMRRLGEPSTHVCGEHPAPAAVHGLSRPGSAPRSASSAGCPAPATRPVRALRRGSVACQLPTGLASRSRGACGLTPCWGRWKRPFDFPILRIVLPYQIFFGCRESFAYLLLTISLGIRQDVCGYGGAL